MAHETYIYYESHIDGKPIPGYADQDFAIDSEVTSYIKQSDSKLLTRLHGYSLNGFCQSDSKGDVAGHPEDAVTVQQEMDVTIVPLVKHFYTTKTLNIGILLTASGKKVRGANQKPRESDVHHFFTFLLGQARIIDLDISRRGGEDMVSMTFKYISLFWQDHDVAGELGETSWKDPTAKRLAFSEVWNERKSG